ncbi:MAG: hypothetical protein ACJZ12_00880 [Candidatus Neomarinimicrobiota bacterium]
MNRYQFEDLISEYIDNELSLKKRKEFEYFLNNNPDYIELVESIKSNIRNTNNLPSFKVSESFNERLLKKISKSNYDFNQGKGKNTYFGFTLYDFSIISILAIAFIIFSVQLFNPGVKNEVSKNQYLTEQNESSSDMNSNNLTNFHQNSSKVDKDSLNVDKSSQLKKNFSKKIQLVND